MQKLLRIIVFIYCFSILKSGLAQDIRGGYIEYKWLSGYTYSITATLLVDSLAAQSHTNISTYFGDGDSCVNTSSSVSGGKILVYKFNCIHTYNGPGTYKAYFIDAFRLAGINNMASSATTSLQVFTTISIDAFNGPGSSPLFPIPVYTANIGTIFNLNMGLSDPDGDSLSYQLVSCIPPPQTQYYIPSNSGINSTTGTFTLQADTAGVFAFKFLIKEWRKDMDGIYQLTGTTEIDFLVEVVGSIGINEYKKHNPILLHPNPASGYLTVKSNFKTNPQIEIINSIGEVILRQTYSENIDVSKLSPGCYFIRVDNSYSKFIKE